MAATQHTVGLSRWQTGVRPKQTPPHRDASISMDAGPSSGASVYAVCNDKAQATNLQEFFSSRAMSLKVLRSITEYINSPKPDRAACVILDLELADISGLEAQSRLAQSGGPPVVFVTAHGDLESGVRAMKNGAIDFLIEPLDHDRLLAAVETALMQDCKNRLERTERLSLLRRWNLLTPREQDVFQYTVAGFLNKQAAAELGISENTFQVHRGRVMKKMKADSLAHLVRMSTRLEIKPVSTAKERN